MSADASTNSDVDFIDYVRNRRIATLSKHNEINNKKSSEEQRKKFFLEIIHICFKYDLHKNVRVANEEQLFDTEYDTENEGTCHEHQQQQDLKEWKVQRIRLSPEFLQKLVDRYLHSTKDSGAIIAYLEEIETGQIILPHDMQRICKAYVPNSSSTDRTKKSHSNNSSCSYELFVSLPNKTKDVMNGKNGFSSYQGQMKFVLHNVPLTSQNSFHTVKPIHVQNWILDGILRENIDVQKSENRIKTIMSSLEGVKKKMERVSEEPVFNERGHEISGKQAQKKREEKYESLQREKDALYIQYDQGLDTLINMKNQILKSVDLSVVQYKKTTTWEFTFHGQSRESLDELVLNKRNWNTSFMYADSDVDLLKGDWDFSTRINSEYLVDSTGISIERLENGFGCFHVRKPTNSDIIKKPSGSHIYAYHGTFINGKKNGFGLLFSHDGIYGGIMKEDMPCDKSGVMIYKDGDIIQGNFDSSSHSSRENRVNPYTRSTPHGQCKVQFSDGAFYEGQMDHGVIHGKGTYISANGEILEGEFRHGNHIRGKRVTVTGDILRGEFENDLLNGEGTIELKSSRCIRKGFFADGSIHGTGSEVLYAKDNCILSTYYGSFCNGRRSGLGCLDFQDVGFRNDQHELEKDSLRVNGYWIAGQPKSGGLILDEKTNFALPTTNCPSSRFRWLCRLKKVEEKKEKAQEQKYQHLSTEADEFHSKIETRKRYIFEQHELSTKSMLYDDQVAMEHFCQAKRDRKKSLPSNAKYYTTRKINKAPSTVEEALEAENPGVQMIIKDDQNQRGLFRRMLDSAKEHWERDNTLYGLESHEMKFVEEEFDQMEEEWSVIDVDKLRCFISIQ